MKWTLGLLLLISSLSASANGFLLLRGNVPLSTKISFEWNQKKLLTSVKTNGHSHQALPKIKIEKKAFHYLVSVTPP